MCAGVLEMGGAHVPHVCRCRIVERVTTCMPGGTGCLRLLLPQAAFSGGVNFTREAMTATDSPVPVERYKAISRMIRCGPAGRGRGRCRYPPKLNRTKCRRARRRAWPML